MGYYRRVHFLCACIHLSSAIAIGVYAHRSNPWHLYKRTVSRSVDLNTWKYRCYGDGAYTSTRVCPDDQKQFYLDDVPDTLFEFNTASAAVSFAAWSGLVHLAASCGLGKGTVRGEHVLRFGVDYAVSAPIMLAVFSVLWANHSWTAVVLAPITLCLLLVLATYLLVARTKAPEPSYRFSRGVRLGFFLVLFLIYGTVLGLTIIRAVVHIRKPEDVEARTGQAPRIVSVISGIFLTIFSLFVVPYFFELKRLTPVDAKGPEYVRYFVIYAALSAIAKVTLHATFGINTVSQTSFLGMDDSKPPESAADQAQQTWTAAGGIVGGGIALFTVVLCLRPTSRRVDG